MIPTVDKLTFQCTQQTFSNPLDWKWLDELPIKAIHANLAKEITLMNIENTFLSFCISTPAETTENRLDFIKKIVGDIHQKCSKNEEIVLISMGCDHLLMEYLIGRALIENGYQKISFQLIEPTFRFTTLPPKHVQKVRDEFNKWIGKAYAVKWNQPLPKDSIHYSPRAESVKNHFKNSPNVAFIECFPPTTVLKNSMTCHIAIKPEELFTGSTFVPYEQANAITFIPKALVQQYKQAGIKLDHSLPFIGFKNAQGVTSCVDWGCKIYPDGKFFLNFFGAQDYYGEMSLGNFNVTFPDGKRVPFNQLMKELKDLIEKTLKIKIDILKTDHPDRKLSQAEITTLLLSVTEQVADLELGWSIFFTADYAVDRSGLVEFLSKNASQHYRKAFSLEANPQNVFKITETTL
jgi:hypothetical protein